MAKLPYLIYVPRLTLKGLIALMINQSINETMNQNREKEREKEKEKKRVAVKILFIPPSHCLAFES